MSNFYYSRGRVDTTIPWNRPNYETIRAYCSYIKNSTDIYQRYQPYIVNGCLYCLSTTWDLDIHLLGAMTSPQQAEDDLDLLLDTALNKFNMLVDCKLVEKISPDITVQNISDPDFTIDFVNNIFVNNIQKIVDGVVVVGEQRSGEKLTENYLYRYSKLAWAPALKKPHLAGGIMASPDKVIRLSMSFDEFLSMSKEQFFTETNCYSIVSASK
jgi:hypothetical protein